MIFTEVPGDIASSCACPAPISPTTGRCTGASALAVTTSAWRTAYPSIAELSNDGRLIGATTSSATASPRASMSGCGKSGSGSMSARMRARWSSTEMRPSAIGEDGVGVDALGGAGLQGHVPHHLHTVAERPVALDPQRGGLLQRRGAVGEAPVELADELVVVAVEVDVRQLRRGLVEHEVLTDVVDVGAQHQQVVGGLHGDEPVPADLDQPGPLEDLDGGAHRGLDLDHLGRRGVAGVEVLDVADQREPQDALAHVERLAHRGQVEPEV